MWLPSDPGRGSLWWSTGGFTDMTLHVFTNLRVSFWYSDLYFCLLTLTITLNSRHQKNGAVISRCSQPEISWWGWRNTDDEYLVTSIAKACQMGTKGTCGAPTCRQRGEAPDSCDSDFGKAAVYVCKFMHALLELRLVICENGLMTHENNLHYLHVSLIFLTSKMDYQSC